MAKSSFDWGDIFPVKVRLHPHGVGLQKRNDYKWIKYVETPASVGISWILTLEPFGKISCMNTFGRI